MGSLINSSSKNLCLVYQSLISQVALKRSIPLTQQASGCQLYGL